MDSFNPLWLCCCTVYWWEASRFLAPKNVGFQLTHNPLSMLPISLHMGMEDVHITPFVLRCWIPQPSINAPNYSPYAYGGCTYYIIRIEMLDSTTFYQCSQLLSICICKVHVLHHLYWDGWLASAWWCHMRQSWKFSQREIKSLNILRTGSKFCPVSNFMELWTLTLATCSYALLVMYACHSKHCSTCGYSGHEVRVGK